MSDVRKKSRIVIIGSGFGGICLAKHLRKLPVEVLLIDRHNYHTFQPLLYQVATGGLEPDSIAYPVRRIFRKSKNFFFRMADVSSVEPSIKVLRTSVGEISYDYLVIATGSTANYYQLEQVKDKMFTMKSVPDALNIRSFLMQNLEQALLIKDPVDLEKTINIAIVGAGPTGVELAGALAEMKRYVLPKDFPELDLKRMHIYLFEAAPQMLSALYKGASKAAEHYLEKLGVNVMLNSKIISYDGHKLMLDGGHEFITRTVIWTAGVKGSPISGLPAECLLTGNRIAVNEYNLVKGSTDIYAIGDVSAFINESQPKGLPMLAPVAIQHGKNLARNFRRMLEGKEMKPFRFIDKGTMATIGRRKAVVDLPGLKFKGTFAWFVWMFVHIMSLVGFRNKLVTFIGWSMNYINYDRPLGLIIRPYHKEE